MQSNHLSEIRKSALETRMITALVQFQLPEPTTLQRARELFMGSAPNYLGVDGLVRKYYLLSGDGRSAGGAYLWRTLEQAESFYSDAWSQMIVERYGAQPTVSYFQTPVVVDNLIGEIVDDG
jgi:hypothetical protein